MCIHYFLIKRKKHFGPPNTITPLVLFHRYWNSLYFIYRESWHTVHTTTLTFRQSNRCNLSWFHWLAIESDQKKGMSIDGDRYWTGSSTTSVRNAESVTSSRDNCEPGQRDVGPIWLPSPAIHQKDRWFRVAVGERDFGGMLPLAHENHMIRIVDIVKSAMRIFDIGLLHDQRAKYAISNVGTYKLDGFLLIHCDVVNTNKKKQFVDPLHSYGSINFCKVSLTVVSRAGLVANKKTIRVIGNMVISLSRCYDRL